jgi:hypothetical protein
MRFEWRFVRGPSGRKYPVLCKTCKKCQIKATCPDFKGKRRGIMRVYSPAVQAALEKNGFFKMTKEERIRRSTEAMTRLAGSGRGDYEAGKRAMLEARGEAGDPGW